MKQIILILFLSLALLKTNAQINFEHTFNTNNETVFNFSTQTQIMYYYVSEPNIYFYNENYTLYKTISIPVQNNYDLSSISYYSTNLFNSDNYIEFCCNYFKDDFTDAKSIIYNENLSVIETFNSSMISYIYPTKNNGYRMNMARYTDFPDNYIIDVYSLPGSYSTNIDESGQAHLSQSPFPNPATSEIIIPYTLDGVKTTEMLIFNSNGQEIESFEIGCHFKEIRLNTLSYSPGIYFYSYNGKTDKFIVQ